MGVLNKLFDGNRFEVKSLRKQAEKVNSYRSEMMKLNDTELQAKTDEFKERLKDVEDLSLIHI